MKLIYLAIAEIPDTLEYIKLLEETKKFFKHIEINNDENGRNKVKHGFVHPRFWSKESFEQLTQSQQMQPLILRKGLSEDTTSL